MPELEKRVDDLETLLGRFMVHSDIALTNLTREIDRLSKEVDRVSKEVDRVSKEVDKVSKEVDRVSKEVDKVSKEVDKVSKEVDRVSKEVDRVSKEVDRVSKAVDRMSQKVEVLSEEMRIFKEEAEKDRRNLHEEMKAFKDEMRTFKEEMTAFKEEMKEETKKKNKEWSSLAKKMGTIVEDLIAPALRPVLKKYFNCEVTLEGQRMFRRKDHIDYEVDAIAACEETVFMIEVRSTPKDRDIDDIKEKAESFFEFFPQFTGRKLVVIFGSITFPDNVIRYASRSGIYIMGWREWEYMDILNFEEVNKT